MRISRSSHELDVITDQAGVLQERLSFDAWGKRRAQHRLAECWSSKVLHWTAYVSPAGYAWQSKPITRGYTGHEQLDPVGLVHMNGRVYDPELGRFLSADAVIQDVTNLQTINAYSYVLNNPLSLTDPTGFFFQGLFRAIGGAFKAAFRAIRAAFRAVLRSAIGRAIIQVMACYFGGPYGCAGITAALTLATGGSVIDAIKSAAFAFVQIQAFAYVGAVLGDVGLAGNYLAKGLVHGVVGGAMSMAQGGGFVQGFAGSAIGAVGGMVAGESGLVGSYGDGITELQLARAAISAAAGCAASAAAGGKCAPAAVTAAFASLYNGDGGWSKYGWAAAEVGAGFIPGVGEAQDLSVLFGKDSSGFERFFAGASLVVNVLTGGLAPNAGSYIRAGSHLCSFDGDTRVKTRLGLLPIKQLKAREHEVWARDADTGEMGWKPITATHINRYDETVTLTIRDGETGATQRIVSNRVHPFYVAHVETKPRLVVNAATLLVGRNASGRWVEAQHLAAGDLLLDADGTFSEVVARSIERSPLTAYNLTVTDFHTYFVAGAEAANDNAPAVWVHNCVLDNAAKGAAGEAKTLQTLGDSVAGTQVSIRTSNGSLTRVDALTTDLVAVETKTGGGGLTLNQAQLFSDVRAGRVVTPVGQNAANAGLTPGQPIRLNGCHLNRC